MTLTSTNNLENLIPELDWNFFLKKMETLEAQKRDKIPAETLMAWFTTLKANSWTNERLEKQILVMLKNVTFGSVKIEDFFNNEEKFTREEMELKIFQRINNMIQNANRLLNGKFPEIELELIPIELDINAVRLAVSKRLQVYYNQEIDFAAIEIINETILSVAEKMGFKKVEFNSDVLTSKQKLKAKLRF